jgi:hypothetical protein
MRVLIDTNICVNRENHRIIPKNLQNLLRALNSLNAEILVHPESVEEIRRDRNEEQSEKPTLEFRCMRTNLSRPTILILKKRQFLCFLLTLLTYWFLNMTMSVFKKIKSAHVIILLR